MNNVLGNVDQRTQLVGHNRLELLLFRLTDKQRYGINVFKVREVIRCPPLTKLPNAHHSVIGVTHIRGTTFTVIDLQKAIGFGAIEDYSKCSVIVTEYNQTMQGFLVPHIEHIINKHWEEILAPPKGTGDDHFLTSVTQVDEQIIEILDVEKVLYQVNGDKALEAHQDTPISETLKAQFAGCHVLVADDSSVARTQIKRTLDSIGVAYTICNDGRIALDTLKNWASEQAEELKNLALVISDVEMPEMDGYTLISEIRKNTELAHLKVVLHTSLSAVFDSALVNDVQADGFLSKFDSETLTEEIKKHLVDFIRKPK